MTTSSSMPQRLESYVCGKWTAGTGTGQTLLSAVTGEPIAVVDSTGIDFAAARDYARDKGGKALRAMSFHERAAMLKELGLALLEVKEELYALSTHTGSTRVDSWVDIEGGIGTLLAYSSKGRRELPNAPVLVDGAVEPLSRDNSFSAQHIYTPLQGVAIHINAFNFPCWGVLEKLAPNLLAGVPAIVKPASQTAYLTELLVRRMLDTGVLPEGALQLVCGSVGNLLELVDGQDVVTFTGSATTGRMLRSSPSIINSSTRFTMEADSLNASILGPEVTPEDPEFALFIKEVVNEMTTKAGQKCTAIRRVLAPRSQIEAVKKALSEALGKVVTGDPFKKETTMGPLASADQVTEVKERVQELLAESTLCFGDADPQDTGASGAYFSPVLLYCDQPMKAKLVHEVEAFGPVSTVMPYDSLDEAVTLANKGQGSLVTSVFSYDAAAVQRLVLGVSAFNGRVLVSNRESAKSSTSHGAPVPFVVHGGPGRAGGGEELGGLRSVYHYMQRTGVQAPPSMLTAVTGRWVSGAKVEEDEVHPFRKSLADLKIGDQLNTEKRTISLEDIEKFAHFTGDTFYAHMNEDEARANPFFDGRVAHGYLVASFAAGLFIHPDFGPVLANYGVDNLRFLTPVYAGDTLGVQLTCKEINPRDNTEYGEVRWDCVVTNQKDDVVAQYDVLTMVKKTWEH